MKEKLLLLLACLFIMTGAWAQSPGLIVRPAAGSGVTPLNPNGDAFSSSSASGFVSSDISESEVPYKIIPPVFLEPTSDLMRGPNELYSDLVRQVDGSGFYVFNTGTNLLFRLRLGNIVSGSKGYSVLIDTDGKIGNTGPYADPNYQAATTGVNGNPGFELEIVLETNFRVAVYNVDGTSTPVLLSSYGINTNSQISVALSTVSGTPDYFYDFYVPISALGVSATTPLRMTATTVMAPAAAIGGPKSDIFGIADTDPIKSWEKVISNSPPVTLNSITSGGGGPGAVCTAAPVLNGPVQAGSGISVTGTWTALDISKPSTALITLYKNGTSAGTVSVNTGNTWTIGGLTVASGDLLYARAQAVGESTCLQSNSIAVLSCVPANTTTRTGLTFACITRKGIRGTRPANASVRLYSVSAAGFTLVADDNSTTYRITYPDATTWWYDGSNGGGSDPCTSSTNDIPDAGYAVTAQTSGLCESGPVFSCQSGNNTLPATTNPTISPTNIYTGTTAIAGTTSAAAFTRVYVNGRLQGSTTADASGNYNFSNLVLALNDLVEVIAQVSGGCVSSVTSRTVTCFTSPPVINTDNNGNLSTASTTITGRSNEPAGTVVTVLENGISIGTPTVQSNGSWSLTYTPVATRSYTATQKNGSCAVSTASAAATALAATTVCPTITGAYAATAATVSGTLPSSFTGTIRLYLDGTNIGSVPVTSATTWSIPVNTNYSNTLYPGGILTVTSQVSGGAEKIDCGSSATITCAVPSTPAISPTSPEIVAGQTVIFNVSNSQPGILYSVTNAAVGTTNYATSKFGTGGGLSLPTSQFNNPGTYNVNINAVSLSGAGCFSSSAALITVTGSLPVTLTTFTGRYIEDRTRLEWKSASEENTDYFAVERSNDGNLFTEIGRVAAKGNSSEAVTYSYNDVKPVHHTAWYRLRMVDKDEFYEYSNTVVIANAIKSLHAQMAMPNPFKDRLQLQVYAPKAVLAQVRLTNVTGQTVYTRHVMVNAGNNNVQLLSLGGLSGGVYFLQLLHHHEVVFRQQVQKVK